MISPAELELALLNDYQHDFPLDPSPFARIGDALGVGEDEVIETYAGLQGEGKVSRIGAVVAPHTVGASLLAAMAVPSDSLERVAALVSSYPEVNHNYQRDHTFNLWFVVATSSQERLQAVLAEIEFRCGIPVLRLPLERAFHIDLGFALGPGSACRSAKPIPDLTQAGPRVLEPSWRPLLAALQGGLALVPHPYQALGQTLGLAGNEVSARIAELRDRGIFKRFGVVVRHHELGYTANAMVVHDIPPELTGPVGEALAKEPRVNLCYSRERDLPAWPYNLFCMIHGGERQEVEAVVADIRRRHGLDRFPSAVLFSTRRFKQQGARYVQAGSPV